MNQWQHSIALHSQTVITKLVVSKDETRPEDFYYNIEEEKNGNTGYKYAGVGSIGNGAFEFGIDCRHHPLDEAKETESMQFINNKLKTLVQPILKKEDLTERFYILKIPDYGQQSMSPFYRDFIPQVFYDGCKIWNKYIGIIRWYTKKVCFILIDKKANAIPSSESDLTYTNFLIRVCFKNNVEVSENTNSSTPSIELENKGENTFSVDNASFIFDDYDFFVNGKLLNPVYIESISYVESGNVLNKQGGESTIDDYFKQSYIRDYQLSLKDDFKRNIKYTITVKLKNNINIDGNKIILKSKSNLYNAMYIKSNINGNNNNISNYLNTNFFVFNADGKLVLDTVSIVNNNDYEIVPQHDSRRIMGIIAASETNRINDMLYWSHFYRCNLINPEILMFDETGILKYYNVYTATAIKSIFIFDGGEEESETLIKSTDEITVSIYPTADEYYNELTQSIDITKSPKQVDKIPLQFYVSLDKEETTDVLTDTKFYCQARTFYIPYETYLIDSKTAFCKLPTAIMNNLNRNIINSIEPIIFWNTTKTGTIYIHDIYSTEELETQKAAQGNSYGTSKLPLLNVTLAPLNIVNFSNRNIK